jgi:hypothetical protein
MTGWILTEDEDGMLHLIERPIYMVMETLIHHILPKTSIVNRQTPSPTDGKLDFIPTVC